MEIDSTSLFDVLNNSHKLLRTLIFIVGHMLTNGYYGVSNRYHRLTFSGQNFFFWVKLFIQNYFDFKIFCRVIIEYVFNSSIEGDERALHLQILCL